MSESKTDIIYLKIKRTSANRLRCTFPGCEDRDSLHNIPKHVRFKAMKQKKIYIPREARACNQHMHNWDTVIDTNIDRPMKFNANQVDDMIQLLCNSGPKMVSEIPGNIILVVPTPVDKKTKS